MGALEELKTQKEITKEVETVTENKKRNTYIFKSKIPNLYIYPLKIKFIKGEYITKDKKEIEALRKMKDIEEVTK